jgi:hypothetical protein
VAEEKATGEMVSFDIKKSRAQDVVPGRYTAVFSAVDRAGIYVDRDKYVDPRHVVVVVVVVPRR